MTDPVAAATFQPPGWKRDHLRDADGIVIVNATPSKSIQRFIYEDDSLAWAISLCSSSAQTGGFACEWTAPEAARRLRAWLLATGWTPPPGERDVVGNGDHSSRRTNPNNPAYKGGSGA